MNWLANIVLSELREILRQEKFRKKGNRFLHEGPDAILWIAVQKSRDFFDGRYKFTVNLGAFLPALARALGEEIRDIDTMNGHWNVRLGHLMPSPTDRWWEVADAEEAAVVGMEVAGLVKQFGLPALKRAGTISGLIDYMERGPGGVYGGSRHEEVTDALKRLRDSGPSKISFPKK